MDEHTETQMPRIAVVGAGPGGLILARLLQVHGFPCTVFEAETGADARGQGGTLDLHPASGQRALREAGLWDEFARHARPEGDRDKIVLADGTVLVDENVEAEEAGSGGQLALAASQRPEIDRTKLRRLLLDAVGDETVRWDHKLVKAEKTSSGDGLVMLTFANGATETFDLVIGADGAWSKVRAALTPIRPVYSSVTLIELWTTDVDAKHPELARFVGAGSAFMMDDDRCLVAQRDGNGDVRTYACVRRPEDWITTCGIDWTAASAATARETLIADSFADCAPALQRLIREGVDGLVPRPLYMMPLEDATWTPPLSSSSSSSSMTLLGDAAHLMTPFAGLGVNLAMADALDLSAALASRREALKRAAAESRSRLIAEAIIDYEACMLPRSRAAAEKTWRGLQMHFSRQGAYERVAKMRGGR